jgi:hypothetical protein
MVCTGTNEGYEPVQMFVFPVVGGHIERIYLKCTKGLSAYCFMNISECIRSFVQAK